MDGDDSNHQRATAVWRDLVATEEMLVTSSYVVVELFALTQRRLGMDAVRALESDVMPILDVVWVGAEIHRRAMAAVLAIGSTKLSLVDCASFEVMRTHGIGKAFALDRDFSAHGFDVVP